MPLWTCPHTCGSCAPYKTGRRSDFDRHLNKTKHPKCGAGCPKHGGSATNLEFKTETTETMAEKQDRPKKRRRTEREGTSPMLEGPARILCVLDPSRKKERYQATTDDVSWLTVTATEVGLEDFSDILSCRALNGYVFGVPRAREELIRIYDWVSTHPYSHARVILTFSTQIASFSVAHRPTLPRFASKKRMRTAP